MRAQAITMAVALLALLLAAPLARAQGYGELRVEVTLDAEEKESCRGGTASVTATVKNLLRGNMPFLTNVTGMAARFLVTPAYVRNLGSEAQMQFVFNFEVPVDAAPGAYPLRVVSAPRDGVITGEAQGRLVVKDCVIAGGGADVGASGNASARAEPPAPPAPLAEQSPIDWLSVAVAAAAVIAIVGALAHLLLQQGGTGPPPQQYEPGYPYPQPGGLSYYAGVRPGDGAGYPGYFRPPY